MVRFFDIEPPKLFPKALPDLCSELVNKHDAEDRRYFGRDVMQQVLDRISYWSMYEINTYGVCVVYF